MTLKINEIIKDLLYLNDSLIIEGLGQFDAKYQPAKKNDIDGTIIPPTKAVSFNTNIKTDSDKVMIKYIVLNFAITEDEAQNSITDFVNATDAKIKMRGEIELKNLGVFYADANGNLAFKQTFSESLLQENYGMHNIPIPKELDKAPITKTTIIKKTKTTQTAIPMTEPEKKKGKTFRRVLIALPIIILLLLLIVFNAKVISWGEKMFAEYVNKKADKKELADNKTKKDSLKNDNTTKLDSTKTIKDDTKKADSTKVIKDDTKKADSTKVVKDETKTDDEKLKKEKDLDVKTEDLGAKYKDYYLIVGSFSQEANAQKLITELTSKGYRTEIIKNNPTKFRVSIGGYDKVDDAITEFKKYVSKNKKAEIWLLKNK